MVASMHACFTLLRRSCAGLLAFALLAALPLVPLQAEEYKIQADDVLNVRVIGEDKLSGNFTVDEKGTINMELVGKVPVTGRSVKEAEQELTKQFAKYLKVFEIRVFLATEVGNKVLVFGEVARQGSLKVRQGAKLLDVIADAGGTTPNADNKRVTIARKTGGNSVVMDLVSLRKDPSKDIPIYPGDTITVPSKQDNSFKVEGEVRQPGVKSLEDYRTAYTAIQASGPTDKADWTRVSLRKKNSNLAITLDLSPVRQGNLKDDYEMEEGDTLTVQSKFTGTVLVGGEVKTPGEKDLLGATSLWEFINSQAGGFTEKADRRRVQIIRKKDGKVETFDMLAVSNGTKRSDDPAMLLAPSDRIFVPIGVAFIRGEVKSTGEKVLGITNNAWDLIMGPGGGFTERADKTKVSIKRDGKLLRTVNLLEVENGKKSFDDETLSLEPGDIIEVPNDESIRFVIVGGVKKPGGYPAYPGTTLLDALGKADGLTERAKRKQVIVAPAKAFGADGRLLAMKNGKKSDKPEELGLIVIDMAKLQKGDATQNVEIKPGDRIFVPEDPPAAAGPRKPGLFDSLLRMLPLAGMFLGGGVGYGYGGYGYY